VHFLKNLTFKPSTW